MARVYLAKHLVLDREYAVKVLFGRAAESERGKRRLEREALALSKLSHPNIVQVFDFGITDDGRPFLTMELLRGETLKAMIARQGPLAPERAAAIARQIALGLEAAHAAGLVHRDLKPSNVLMIVEDGRDVPKILDFGIVLTERGETRITASDQLLGTPRYMAPEQIRGASTVGPSADLYALGAVLFTMLTGKPPFSGSTIDVIERQLTEKPRRLDTGTPLDDLVEWLLAKGPEERPPNAERVVAWLEDAGFGPEATRTQILPPPPPPAPMVQVIAREGAAPSRLLMPALLALLIAVGALAGALLWPRTPAAPRTVPPPVSIPAKAPVVIARTEDAREPATDPPENLPPPVSKEPKEPKEPSPRVKRPKPRPKKTESAEDMRREVVTAMKKLGFTRRDVWASPALQPLLRDFERSVEPEEMKHTKELLLAALARTRIDDAMVKTKLDRVAKALAAQKLDQPTLDRLENRYLDLRSSFRSDLSPADLLALMLRIDALEGEVAHAAAH